MPPKRGHGVHHHQRVVRARSRGDLLHGVLHAGRRLRVHDRHDDRRRPASSARPTASGVDRAPPLPFHAPHVAAVARGHLREAVAEVAVDHRQHAGPRRHEVGDGGLHAGRAGARHRQGERPLRRAKHPRERRAHVVHQVEQRGIEVAEHGRGHRAHHARGHRARPRAEQQPFGRRQCGHAGVINASY